MGGRGGEGLDRTETDARWRGDCPSPSSARAEGGAFREWGEGCRLLKPPRIQKLSNLPSETKMLGE